MAGGEGEIGAVQRVEMELLDAFALQAAAEIAGDGGGDHAARLEIVVEAVEQFREPWRYFGAAKTGNSRHSLEVRHRHDARHDRHVDSGCGRAIAEAQEVVGLEEELGDA